MSLLNSKYVDYCYYSPFSYEDVNTSIYDINELIGLCDNTVSQLLLTYAILLSNILVLWEFEPWIPAHSNI